MTLDKPTLERILRMCIYLEDNDSSLTKDDYWAIIRLAQAVEAPSFVIEHFARIAAQFDLGE